MSTEPQSDKVETPVPPPPVVESDAEVEARVAKAFEESPILFDEVLRVWKNGDGAWRVTSRSAQRLFIWAAKPDDALGFTFTEEVVAPFTPPPFRPVDVEGVGGGLLELEQPSTLAEMMSAEIQNALGPTPTPESCEQAIAMTTAARDFLLAKRMSLYRSATPTENFQKMVEVFGVGARDDDPFP